MENRELCTSVFKSGKMSREIYTAVWVTLIHRLSGGGRISPPKEEKT